MLFLFLVVGFTEKKEKIRGGRGSASKTSSNVSNGTSSVSVTKTGMGSGTGQIVLSNDSGQPNVPTNAQDLSNSPDWVNNLVSFEQANFDPDQVSAIKSYISKQQDAKGFTMSQNLNFKLDNNLPLSVNEQFMNTFMQSAMHTLGQDITLYRGAHQDLLERLGVKNYHTMSESQLQKALIGKAYTTTSYSSTSYDKSKNPFYTGANAGGREVELVMKTGKNTKVVLGAKSQTEIVTNIGTNYKVTGVRFTGRTATPRAKSGSYPVVELTVETF